MISPNFKKVFGYSLMFFLGLYLLSFIFGALIESVSARLEPISASIETGLGDTSGLGGIIAVILLLELIYIGSLAYLYAYTENKVWCIIYNKKADFKSSAKLFLLSVMMFLILLILLLIFGWLFLSAINLGIISRVIFFLIALLAGYMLYVSYISFTHTRKIWKSVKESFTKSFSNLDKTSVLLLTAGLLAIIVDWIALWAAYLPEIVFFIISALLLALYAAWFKISLAKALKSVKF